jgi:hypothetical protein
MDYHKTASREVVDTTIGSLQANGISGIFVESQDEARKKIAELIPEGSEVMTMTSKTLEALGIAKEINESGKYNSVRTKLADPKISPREKRMLGAAPDFVIGSVHAVTEDGKVLIASNTGSQLPGYAYGAGKVIWVIGTQKIVPDLDSGLKRLYDYVLPLESDRAHKAYGTPGSNVSKLLIVNKEVNPARITVVFVNESLGF